MGKSRRTIKARVEPISLKVPYVTTVHSETDSAQVIVTSATDHLQACWRAGAFYEYRMLRYIQGAYSRGTFVDAGSSIGNHTLFFAKFCDPDLVVSIEPVLESLALQRRVLELNDLTNLVQTHHVALSNTPGRGAMRPFGDPTTWNMGMYELSDGDEVEVTTLDTLVEENGLDDVTLIKMDVEWSELIALWGARRLLEEQCPALFVELSSKAAYDSVTQFLVQFGYRQIARFNKSPTYEFIVP